METLEIQTRRLPAALAPSSYDAKTRTFEAIVTTGAGVKRVDSAGIYTEVLDVASINPAAMIGLPVLVDHNPSFDSHVGTITAARVEGGNLIASIKLTSDSSADPVARKVEDGVLNSMSLGYRVGKWTEKTVNGARVRTAGEIQPVEASLVATPADSGARIRKDSTMEPEIISPPVAPILPDATTIAHRAAVRDLATRSGLASAWADSQIDSGADLVSVRAAAHEAMLARAQTIRVVQTAPSGDDPSVILSRRVDGLHAHTTGAAPKPEAREFVYDTLSDHVRSMLASVNVSTRGLSKADLYTRAAMHVAGDFSALLQGVGNRTLLASYEASRTPLVKLFRKTSRTDFRATFELRISELGALEKVSESGEFKSKTRSELSQSFLMDTYAGKFSISRKALINDDLGAFADASRAFGLAAATTESNLMVALLESNPVMTEDGAALFHASHGNLAAAGAAIDVDSLSDGRASLRKMKGLDGKTPIAVNPRYLVVSADRETEAEKMLASIGATMPGDVNPFSGKLELLVDPSLASEPWYIAGAPEQFPCLSYAVLNGNEVPTVEVQNLFDQLGTSVRAYHDFGVGAQDWRSLYKNPGV